MASKPPQRTAAHRIRDGVAADVTAVIRLDAQVTGVAKTGYWHNLFERYLGTRQRGRYVLVAETGSGDVVGFIIGEVRAWEFGSAPCGWVFAVSVAPGLRLEGIGSDLFDAISERFRAIGVDKIRTMLSRDNHLLMSFFRSHGMMAGPYIQLEKPLDEEFVAVFRTGEIAR
ncbi:MAG: GNAT family N-acetyltransferase [Alphaproteobacteria bacterium]|nr:GNAT family N-acetyltransferase [Alphaproteobacteria bacterium]